MKNFKVRKGFLVDKVFVPPSKSYANRSLIIAAILNNSPRIKNLPQATDVLNLIFCLKKMGLNFTNENNELHFTNSFPQCEHEKSIEVNVGEGGTTARFLAAMCLLGKSEYTLVLGDRLKDRPWKEFIEVAHRLGAKASLEGSKLKIQGPMLMPSEITIDCSKTTQFATAFQLLSQMTQCKVIPVQMTSSQSYWAMTERIIEEIGKKEVYEIPLDWSSASYPLAFAALNQRIEFPGLHDDPYQADAKFLNVLEKFNCITKTEEGMVVTPLKTHQTVKMDVSDCLDLVPTLGYFLAHVDGSHELRGVGNLVHKESDRLKELMKLLGLFNRKTILKNDILFIEGSRTIIEEKLKLEMPDDHRMVMVGTLFLLHHSGGEISPENAVAKSYPEFFKLIR